MAVMAHMQMWLGARLSVCPAVCLWQVVKRITNARHSRKRRIQRKDHRQKENKKAAHGGGIVLELERC